MQQTRFLFKANPYILIATTLIVGIILQDQFNCNGLIGSFGLGVSLGLIFVLLRFIRNPRALKFRSIIVLLAVLFTGMVLHNRNNVKSNANWYGKLSNDTSYYKLKINKPIDEKQNSFSTRCTVESVLVDGKEVKANGEILVYFKKSDTARQLAYGQIILVQAKLQAIKSNGHPGGFNFEQYMARQQLFHQTYLKPNDFIVFGEKQFHFFYTPLYAARTYVLNALKKHIGKNEQGVSEALLIGYTNDLDRDLLQAYSDSGVVHVIAVSGMHLALIFTSLNFLFSLVPFLKKRPRFQGYVILMVLWAFAMLAGGAPSIVRAAVMCSIITLSYSFSGQSSLMNSLFNTAFILLCFNTNSLWDVGFQLSFIALFSIAACNDAIKNWFTSTNIVLRKIWELLSATIAAQIFTAPIIIYYFHQFPLMFLLGNLIAVPLSSAALIGELVLVFVNEIPFVGSALGWLITKLLWLMNAFVVWLSNFSFASINDISVTALSTVLFYLMIALLTIWLLHRKKQMLIPALATLVVWLAAIQIENITKSNQKHFIVYNISRHWAFEFIHQNKFKLWADSSVQNDSKIRNFNLKSTSHYLRASEADSADYFERAGFYSVWKLRIFHAHKKSPPMVATQPITVDYVILSENTKVGPKQVSSFCNAQLYIFDASNSLWKIEKWKTECNQLNLRHYSVAEKGTFHQKF